MDYASGVWSYEEFAKPSSVQHRAARVFLGVHRFVPIPALEGDIGWLAPRYRRWINMLRLWNRLVGLEPNRLTHHIFVHDFYMAQSNSENWCYKIWQILCAIGYEECFYNREPCDINSCKEKLLQLQENHWKVALQHKHKLRFYRLFKSNVQVEKYVQYNLTVSERSFTAQLRSGTLPLHVETGRFRNIKLENRICSLCQLNEIEDEVHFLFKCPLYNEVREKWLHRIRNEQHEFDNDDISSKLTLLFTQYH
jgi:hypothetical protein